MVSIDVNTLINVILIFFCVELQKIIIITYRNAKLEQRFKVPDLNLAYLRRLATVNTA